MERRSTLACHSLGQCWVQQQQQSPSMQRPKAMLQHQKRPCPLPGAAAAAGRGAHTSGGQQGAQWLCPDDLCSRCSAGGGVPRALLQPLQPLTLALWVLGLLQGEQGWGLWVLGQGAWVL